MKLSLKKLGLSFLLINLLALSPSYGESSPEELEKRPPGKEATGAPPNDTIGKKGNGNTEAEVVSKSFSGETIAVKDEPCSDCTDHGIQSNLVESSTVKQPSSNPDTKKQKPTEGTK
ncbi:MAG TPA: hypothetical protein PLJ21_04730 [Pseudobdellovibrionaceae bacterium]|nr:hypothetical protein [Pseudobdellovibrionaceae bacterium]